MQFLESLTPFPQGTPRPSLVYIYQGLHIPEIRET